MRDGVFRVFLSSTFRDMEDEREELRRRVFPQLAARCAEHGATLDVVDLRWGIAAAAQAEWMTMELCLAEVRRSREATRRPNFIALLGDRYGWVPPPVRLEVPLYERIAESLDDDGQALLRHCYAPDHNADPPAHALKRGSDTEVAVTPRDLDALQQLVAEVSHTDRFSEEERLALSASATEQEVRAGLDAAVSGAALAFIRNLPPPSDDMGRSQYFDGTTDGELDRARYARAQELKAHVRSTLGGDVYEFGAVPVGAGITTDHLDDLCLAVHDRLGAVLDEELAVLDAMSEVDRERRAHLADAPAERELHGRARELEVIDELLAGPGGEVLVLHGRPGAGRSALVAHALAAVRSRDDGTIAVYRRIGSTAASGTPHSLLESLSDALSAAVGAPPAAARSYHDLRSHIRGLLEGGPPLRPVALIIDGLERLSYPDVTHIPEWLPPRPARNVHIVVSTLSGDHSRELEHHLDEARVVELDPLSPTASLAMFSELLTSRGRTISAAQSEVVHRYLDSARTPFQVDLLAARAAAWSAEQVPEPMGDDEFAVIGDFVGDLASDDRHGMVLSKSAFGYLTLTRFGLTEAELVDVLSADDAVMGDLRRRNPEAPTVDRLPQVVWSRLALDARPLLTSTRRGSRDVLAPIRGHDLDLVLAELPGPSPTSLAAKLVDFLADQPYTDEADRPNGVKVIEYPYQLGNFGSWGRLVAVLADPRYLPAALDVDELGVHQHLRRLEEAGIGAEEVFADALKGDAPDRRLLQSAALLLKERNQAEAALTLFERLIDGHEGPVTPDQGTALGNAADLNRVVGRLDAALESSYRATAAFMELGDLGEVARTLGNRALVFEALGDDEMAERLHEREERLFRFLDDQTGLQTCLDLRSSLYLRQGRLEDALTSGLEAAELASATGDVRRDASINHTLAEIHWRLRNLPETVAAARRTEQIADFLGFHDLVVSALQLQVAAWRDQGSLDPAVNALRRWEAACPTWGSPRCPGLWSTMAASVSIEFGRHELAEAQLDEARALLEPLGATEDLARVAAHQLQLAGALRDAGARPKAYRSPATKAMEIAADHPEMPGSAEIVREGAEYMGRIARSLLRRIAGRG